MSKTKTIKKIPVNDLTSCIEELTCFDANDSIYNDEQFDEAPHERVEAFNKALNAAIKSVALEFLVEDKKCCECGQKIPSAKPKAKGYRILDSFHGNYFLKHATSWGDRFGEKGTIYPTKAAAKADFAKYYGTPYRFDLNTSYRIVEVD